MKAFYKSLIVLSCVLLINDGFAQAPNWQWAKSGGHSRSTDRSIALDAIGNSYIAGTFTDSSITFGNIILTNAGPAGSIDFFIVKYDASGNVIWAKSAGGIAIEYGNRLTLDANANIYMTGEFASDTMWFGNTFLVNSSVLSGSNWDWDIFNVKYDSSGTLLWAKGAGGDNNQLAFDVATDINSNSYITGYFDDSTATFGSINLAWAGFRDFLLLKYDASGNVVWAKRAGGNGSEQGNSIATDGAGNSYIAGGFDNDTLIFGSDTLINIGINSPDIFIVKYDSSGNALWAKSARGYFDMYGSSISISIDASGNSYITGGFKSPIVIFGSDTLTNAGNNTYDFFIAKYDAQGNFMWARSEGGTDNDDGEEVTADASGNAYLTGYFRSAAITFGATTLTNGNVDALFIAKYDASGNVLWAKSAAGRASSNSIEVMNGNAFITGNFVNSTTFGSTTLTSTFQSGSFFIAKLDVEPAGITENAFSTLGQLLIMPNPANNSCTITCPVSHATLTLYDITGRALLQQPFNTKATLDVGALARGVYIAEVKDKQGKSAKGKVVKN